MRTSLKKLSKQWENNERSPIEGVYTRGCVCGGGGGGGGACICVCVWMNFFPSVQDI